MSRIQATSVGEWADVCSRAFVPLGVRTSSAGFRATLDRTELSPQVSLTHVASAGSEVFRSRRIIAAHPRDDLLLSVQRSGLGTIAQSGRAARLRPRQAALYDAAAPYTLQFPGPMSELVLQVPRRLIHRSRTSLAELTARPLPSSAALTTLSGLLQSVAFPTEPDRAEDESALLADAIGTLLHAALIPADRPATTRIEGHALFLTMRTFIDDHLDDRSLGVEALAAAHHISVRLVHRIFAEHEDTPGACIRRARLARARILLTGGASVAGAAQRCGFGDPDTFRRAFRREYGILPSQLPTLSTGTPAR